MAIDLSKVPIERRIVISDEPVYAGRTASILVSHRDLHLVLAQLIRQGLFFSVTPYRGKMYTVACKFNQADHLVKAVGIAEKRR